MNERREKSSGYSSDSSMQSESQATPTREPPKTSLRGAKSISKLERFVEAASSFKKNGLTDTVSSFREIASDTIGDVKDWANQNLNPETDEEDCSPGSENHWADNVSKMYAPRTQEDGMIMCSDRAVETLYGAKSSMHLLGRKFAQNDGSERSTVGTIFQSVISPFVACGGGITDRGKRYSPNVDCTSPQLNESKTSASSARSNYLDPILMAFHDTPSFDDGSLCTTDSNSGDYDHVRDMTSRETIGTYKSERTSATHYARSSTVTRDDDGRVIPRQLLEQRERRRQLRHARRKRLVKFSYPPITSVREFPRADPADLPNLFYTEEELDQMEDDRFNTMTADDVELVAVSSGKNKEDASDDWDELMFRQCSKTNSTDATEYSTAPFASFSRYVGSPKQSKKNRPKSP